MTEHLRQAWASRIEGAEGCDHEERLVNIGRNRATLTRGPKSRWDRRAITRMDRIMKDVEREMETCPHCSQKKQGSQRIAYSGPIGGIDLKELWDGMQAMLSIVAETKAEKALNGPTHLARVKVPFGVNFPSILAALDQEAQQKHRQIAESLAHWGVTRYVLLGHGRNDTFTLGEKAALGEQWALPRKAAQPGRSEAKLFPSFLRTMHYGSHDELVRLWAEEIADVPYDDSQFDLIEGKPHVIVYRGIELQQGQDPATSKSESTGGTGYSWTLAEETAYAIAERGGAGFSGDNRRTNDAAMISLRDEERGIKLPTVLRGEVVLTGDAAKPYRPWNWSYRSELEIDIPKGTTVMVTGWRQAKPVPVSKAIYDRAHGPGIEPYSPESYWYVSWVWGPWHTGRWQRQASA